MSWLDPSNVQPSGYNLDARVSEFVEKHGQLGEIALEAWNRTDPFHCLYDCNSDEYLGYARRFVEAAARIVPGEWSNHSGLVEELVRRSLFPTQVVNHIGIGGPWATAEHINSISQFITERVDQLGGMEKFLPES